MAKGSECIKLEFKVMDLNPKSKTINHLHTTINLKQTPQKGV